MGAPAPPFPACGPRPHGHGASAAAPGRESQLRAGDRGSPAAERQANKQTDSVWGPAVPSFSCGLVTPVSAFPSGRVTSAPPAPLRTPVLAPGTLLGNPAGSPLRVTPPAKPLLASWPHVPGLGAALRPPRWSPPTATCTPPVCGPEMCKSCRCDRCQPGAAAPTPPCCTPTPGAVWTGRGCPLSRGSVWGTGSGLSAQAPRSGGGTPHDISPRYPWSSGTWGRSFP